MSTDTSTEMSTGTSTEAAHGPVQRVQVAIRATPEQVWAALTDGTLTPAYYYGFRAEYGDLTAGGTYRYSAGGGDVISGRLLDVLPGRRLVMTFAGSWSPEVAALAPSQVAFHVLEPSMPMPGVTLLVCEHSGLPATQVAAQLEQGWVLILSGLKTLLETGQPLSPATA